MDKKNKLSAPNEIIQQSSELKDQWLIDFLESEIDSNKVEPPENWTSDLSGLKNLRNLIKDLDPVLQMEQRNKSNAQAAFYEKVFEEKLVQKLEKQISESRCKVWWRSGKKMAGFVAMYCLVIGTVFLTPRAFYKEASLVANWSNQESSSVVEFAATANSSEVYLDMMFVEDRLMTLSEVNYLIK